jgi:lipid II:glycine glycyltransferase (peptidoglycan interpeptide bridge formation enzyme)
MLIVDKKILNYSIKEIHFFDHPHDMNGCSVLKFFYCNNKENVKGFTCQKELTTVIDLTQDLDTIFKNMNKDTRYNIRRAQKDGIDVQINKYQDEFFQLYSSFLQKKGLKSIFDVFGIGNAPVDILKKYGTLLVAIHNNEILAGGIYLEDESFIKGWIGASKRLEADKKKRRLISYSNRLIEWEAMKYAKEKEIKEFDFGGLWPDYITKIDEQKKGINSFKLGFGGKIVTRYSYQKFYSKSYQLFYKLYILKNLKRKEDYDRF